MAATSFPLFMYLPFELRARVWELTAEPRTVKISRDVEVLLHYPVPAIVQVCREARQLGIYRKVFFELDEWLLTRRYVWLSMELDMVDISGSVFLSSFKPSAASITRLKFQKDSIVTDEIIFLGECVNLKELHIVPYGYTSLNWYEVFTRLPLACGLENIFMVDSLLGLVPLKPEYTSQSERLITELTVQSVERTLRALGIQWGLWGGATSGSVNL